MYQKDDKEEDDTLLTRFLFFNNKSLKRSWKHIWMWEEMRDTRRENTLA